MNFQEKIDKAHTRLTELFSKQLADDCINYIASKIIIDIINNKDELADSDINILFFLGLDQTNFIESDDIIDLICEMTSQARERSHGAAPLSKVYISSKHYDKIVNDLGFNKKTLLTVGKVKVYRSDKLVSMADCVGICVPKFKCVSQELVIILGKINKEKV